MEYQLCFTVNLSANQSQTLHTKDISSGKSFQFKIIYTHLFLPMCVNCLALHPYFLLTKFWVPFIVSVHSLCLGWIFPYLSFLLFGGPISEEMFQSLLVTNNYQHSSSICYKSYITWCFIFSFLLKIINMCHSHFTDTQIRTNIKYVTIIVSPLFPSLIDGFSLKPQNTELKTITKKAHRIIKLEYVN